MTKQQNRNGIKKLQEKLILTAIESKEFKELLIKAVRDIRDVADNADNEATIESNFEIQLYGLLKEINFTFVPAKEHSVDTRRHVGKGRIDSKIGAVVIEYKHPTKLKANSDIKNASEQLIAYLGGLWAKAPSFYYGFLTDGRRCKEIVIDKDNLITEGTPVDFTYIEALRLIRNIVLLDKTELTPGNLIKDFCYPKDESLIYQIARTLFLVLKKNPTKKTQMLQMEWEQLFRLGHEDKSQQRMIQEREEELRNIIGGEFESYDQYVALFALQTTYAIVIKLIAYRIISEIRFDRPIKSYHSVLKASDKTLRIFSETLEEGDIFRDLGIINLLEGDFFSWYSDSEQWNPKIATHIRKILELLARYENATEVFKTKGAIDLFKGIYQNIIPQVVRSSLGEFYTPSWLAEHVFKSIKPLGHWRGLDPCAGSGTFLLVMIDEVLRELKDEPKELQLREVLKRVQAIDLNPLAVLTSRINYFIRISNLIPERPEHIQIPVYLGDACYVPERVKINNVPCFRYSIKTMEEPIDIVMPESLTEDTQKFSELMTEFEKNIRKLNYRSAIALLIRNLKKDDTNSDVICELDRLTKRLIELERRKWNGIWARIITNFLTTANLGRFAIIISNPPWIDWKNLPSGYRNRIKSLCIDRNLFSGDGRTGGINLNVCALITSVSIENWLSDSGKFAFLMPKVIAFQQSYDGFRKFRYHKVKRDFLGFIDWSRSGHPFFPITERFMTFIIGPKQERSAYIPVKEYIKKKGYKIAGEDHISLAQALERLTEVQAYAGQIMPHSTAFTMARSISDLRSFEMIAGEPDYIGREGIEFYPQELLLFRIAENPPAAQKKGCLYFTNIQFKKSKYRVPTDILELEIRYLFPLVRGTEIKKFQHDYSKIFVPFPYESSNPKQPLDRESLQDKSPRLLDYYLRYEELFRAQTGYSDKLRGINPGEFYGLARVGPYSFADYYVAFRDNTKWGATVISPKMTKLGERKRFVFQNHAVSICEDIQGELISEDEAHYVCAILNAPIVEKYILQSSDSRSFKIRPPIRIPKYKKDNPIHKGLSQLSRQAHLNAAKTKSLLLQINSLYLKMLE